MRNIKLVIEYDGTHYKGWQFQRNEPTLQGVIEEKLGTILDQPTRIVGSGRTDTGVHALNQVAHFRTTSRIELTVLKRGLNSLLPPDIVVKELTEVESEFHARYSAKSRVYKYLIWNGDVCSAFYQRFAWHLPHDLDIGRMREAAECLVGIHDFASFQGGGSACRTTVREIIRCTVNGRAGRWIITTIEATAFLRRMVLTIVGALVEVGRGDITVEDFKGMIKAKNRAAVGAPAPPQGLFLKKVNY